MPKYKHLYMRLLIKNIILDLLASLARRRISRDATIIGITGSVGKTTAKEALVKILETKYRVLATKKSMNSEFGVPLTLLEEQSGYSSPLAWLGILARSVLKSFHLLPAEKIVLEMGVDAPGDMDVLLNIMQPDIGVMLAVAPVHLADGQFTSLVEIAAEKGKLIGSLDLNGVAIVNGDDARTAQMTTSADKLSFGMRNPANLTAHGVHESATGITAEISCHGDVAQLNCPLLGKHNLYPILAAIGVGLASDMTLQECCDAINDFQLPPGRGNLLAGLHGSYILDASYNANPASTHAGLETLARLDVSGRRIALLGQMNELGTSSEQQHRDIGQYAAQVADEVIGVYGDAQYFVEEAKAAGTAAQYFETAAEAGDYLATRLAAGDLVLAKGSQNKVRVEQAVARMLAHPEKAEHLLCRQESYWQEH